MRSGGGGDETANARYGRWDWRGRGRKEGGNGKEMAVLEKRGHATHVSLFHKTCLFLPCYEIWEMGQAQFKCMLAFTAMSTHLYRNAKYSDAFSCFAEIMHKV